jgi:ABC-type Fe3+/spermidine/putrescine transport system ATPase subunit
MTEIKISNLLLERGTFQLQLDALQIQPGEILGVMGKSGSGKTSLLHSIAGFFPIKEGQVSVFGREISRLDPEKRKVALVFQKPWLFEHQTVIENIFFGLKLQGVSKEECIRQAEDWLKKMEIPELRDRKVWELSGGQAQRVSLARALAVGFPLLLLDEPFSALDAPLRKGLRALVRRLVKESGKSAILVSHDWRDIEEAADSVLILDSGRKVAWGTLEEIKASTDSRVKAICEE